jgi:2-methylisocitrate lyase-like PEP mutase family enzyme
MASSFNAQRALQAALDRALAYQEAGADFLFIEAPLSSDEQAAIPRAVPGIRGFMSATWSSAARRHCCRATS